MDMSDTSSFARPTSSALLGKQTANGQTVPPPVASKLIDVARDRGHTVTFDEIYGSLPAKEGA